MTSERSNPRQVFVTVGSQMPFARLVDAVDRWLDARAAASGAGGAALLPLQVFGQIGAAARPTRAFPSVAALSASEYEARVAEADLVVAHAGTGTIFTALRYGTPLLVLARRADLAETRNDHQDATALRFEARGLLEYARDEQDLADRLTRWAAAPRARDHAQAAFAATASGPLVERLRGFFDEALGGASAAPARAPEATP
ncbi:MAG: glycosyltransferase [Planctomycetota bacterium]